ncbi:MAG TPA: recombinase family protein [Mycobacteriales bacterium]|nr:recombinase family protein [Mycobacteriales bacterium]
MLRRRGVALVNVTENIEETASGRLVEGIHALMAEFYSANLAAEVRKGMGQKAKQGGYPHAAPLGYRNVRETIAGRRICRMEIDPDRAPLVKLAFELYLTGEYTLDSLVDELARRGLRNLGRRDYPPKPLGVTGVAHLLANKAYAGIVEWDGVEDAGQREPLIDRDTFRRVQALLAARAVRGIRNRKYNHYRKGLLGCAVCARALSIQVSKGTYIYFYCLGQKGSRAPTGFREAYVPADRLETEIINLYRQVELPPAWVDRLRADLQTEITHRQHDRAAQREFATRALAEAEAERRKILDAYYANAIDLTVLKREQERVGADIDRIQAQLADLDASLTAWQEILDLAIRFAGNCATAYSSAEERTRRLFNNAVFETITVAAAGSTPWSTGHRSTTCSLRPSSNTDVV